MKLFLWIVLFLLIARWALAASGVTIKGGPVSIKGGYVDLGVTVVVSTSAITERAGQAIGLLLPLTYN